MGEVEFGETMAYECPPQLSEADVKRNVKYIFLANEEVNRIITSMERKFTRGTRMEKETMVRGIFTQKRIIQIKDEESNSLYPRTILWL